MNPPDQQPPADRARERADALREVMEVEAKRQALESERAEPSKSGKRLMQVVNAAIVGFCAYIWLFNPSWVTVEGAPPVPIDQEEDALRLSMYIQAQQIESFKLQQNRVPTSLEEVGPPLPGMHFQRVGRSEYRLTGVSDRLTLVYDSADSLTDFVGDADQMIDPGNS